MKGMKRMKEMKIMKGEFENLRMWEFENGRGFEYGML
jgi:hypothetical protein